MVLLRQTCRSVRSSISPNDMFDASAPALAVLQAKYYLTSRFLGSLRHSSDESLVNCEYMTDFMEALGFAPSCQSQNLFKIDGTWRLMLPEPAWNIRVFRSVRLLFEEKTDNSGTWACEMRERLADFCAQSLGCTLYEVVPRMVELPHYQVSSGRPLLRLPGPPLPPPPVEVCLASVFGELVPHLSVLDLVLLKKVSRFWHSRVRAADIVAKATLVWEGLPLTPAQRSYLASPHTVAGSYLMCAYAGRPSYPTDIDVWVGYPGMAHLLPAETAVLLNGLGVASTDLPEPYPGWLAHRVITCETQDPSLRLQLIYTGSQSNQTHLLPTDHFDISVCKCGYRVGVPFHSAGSETTRAERSARRGNTSTRLITVSIDDPIGLAKMQGTYSVFTRRARLAKYRARGFVLTPEVTGFAIE